MVLILGRKLGESIVIQCPGGQILKVTFAGFHRGHAIRIGIDAPADFWIDREEIFEMIKADGRVKN